MIEITLRKGDDVIISAVSEGIFEDSGMVNAMGEVVYRMYHRLKNKEYMHRGEVNLLDGLEDINGGNRGS